MNYMQIGDGGTRKKLEEKLKELNVQNVELLNPVARKELIDFPSYRLARLNSLKIS